MLFGGFGIDLWNHQWHLRIHAESAAVVNHDCSGVDRMRGELLAAIAPCGEEGEVNVLEGIRGQFFNRKALSPELERFSCGTGRGQQPQALHGEVPNFQQFEEFGPHRAGRPGNHYSWSHKFLVSVFKADHSS